MKSIKNSQLQQLNFFGEDQAEKEKKALDEE
jgi:hypothetical protein